MKWLPGPHQMVFTLIQKVYDFVEIKIKEHKESLDPSSPRDYIDCFLTEMGEVSVFYLSVMCLFSFLLSNEICLLCY